MRAVLYFYRFLFVSEIKMACERLFYETLTCVSVVVIPIIRFSKLLY